MSEPIGRRWRYGDKVKLSEKGLARIHTSTVRRMIDRPGSVAATDWDAPYPVTVRFPSLQRRSEDLVRKFKPDELELLI